MPKFSQGLLRFQNEVYPEYKALFETLSEGQAPEALFVTCSDSRIETGMLTQCGPGELFVCRNAGNIIPPHQEHAGGVTASLEFAMAVLNVPHLVICGHTGCGAMAAALDEDSLADLPHIRAWLQFVKEAVKTVRGKVATADKTQLADLLAQENVVLQLAHARTHPAVTKRLEKGDLELHGWVYNIRTGGVSVFDETRAEFVPAGDYYV